MNVYLAGWQGSTLEREERAIKAGVIKHRCISFANVVKIPGLPYYVKGIHAGYTQCVKHGVGIMMDSGVFSYRTHKSYLMRTKKGLGTLPELDDYIRLYVEFCKANHKKWDFYVTVDLTKVASKNIIIHKRLEKMGIRPMPVFHGDDTIEYLRRYHDMGYDYICVGSVTMKATVTKARRYFDSIFNMGAKLGLTFHGLAQTAPWVMLDYSWRSVDSSSWSRAAGYGCILRFNEEKSRMSTMHISDRMSSVARLHRNPKMSQAVKRDVEAEGYDFAELQSDHTARHIYNAATMLKLAAVADKRQGGGFNLLF